MSARSACSFCAEDRRAREAGLRLQMLNAEHSIADVTAADILVVPDGDASGPIGDPAVLEWIRGMHTLEALRHFGTDPVRRRFVREGKIVTAAGVSAGIDMALALVAIEHGDEMAKTIQLIIEYDPQPPFDTGSTKKASAAMVERARQMLVAMYAQPGRQGRCRQAGCA